MSSETRILVTGSNRSGSTWVGKVLATHNKVDNIIEPLNLNRIKQFGVIDYDYWYPKIDRENPASAEIGFLINYYLKANYSTFFTEMFKSYEGHNLLSSSKKRLRRAGRPIKLLKDPTALFSVPWLVEEFKVKPIILIRHPAAYVLSIKEKNWWFDFDNMLKQTHFFNGELESLKAEVAEFKKYENSKDIIDNASLLWKVFYAQVKEYQNAHPNWFYITHETLSMEPLKYFEELYQYLGLEFRDTTKHYILETTQSSKKEEFKRDAKKNAEKWMHSLSDSEKKRIYKIVGPISHHFYKNWI